jgi:hypothetical protein
MCRTRLADLYSYPNVIQLSRKHLMANERFVSASNITGPHDFERGKFVKETLTPVT